MFSVEPNYNKYTIKLSGDRRKYTANTLEEVHNALNHYHAQKHDKENCPFCRDMAKRGEV